MKRSLPLFTPVFCGRPLGRESASPILVVLASVLMGSCGEGREHTQSATTRSDSAGVEIVTVRTSPGAVPVLANLDSAVVLRAGLPSGTAEEQFGAVVDVVALSDGGLAVLDGQASEIRVFGPGGAYRSTLGQRGDGPGELREPVDLTWLAGDTLAVYDRVPRRVTRFGIDGGSARTTTLDDVGAVVSDARFAGDGRLVGQSHLSSSGAEPVPNGEPVLVRNTVVLRLFDGTGAVVSEIDTVPSLEEIVSIRFGGGALSVIKRPPVFGRDNLFVPGPAGTWSFENDRFELRLRDTNSGRLIRVVRAPAFDAPPADRVLEDIRLRVAEDLESEDEQRQEEEWLALSPKPELQPAFDALATDQRGRAWVRSWTPFGKGRRWWVFEPDGDLMGSLETPTAIRITSITCDAIAGIERDDLGVTYAVRYALTTRWLCERVEPAN